MTVPICGLGTPKITSSGTRVHLSTARFAAGNQTEPLVFSSGVMNYCINIAFSVRENPDYHRMNPLQILDYQIMVSAPLSRKTI